MTTDTDRCRTHRLPLLAWPFIAALGLAACGDGSSTTADAEEPAAQSVSTPEEPTAPAETATAMADTDGPAASDAEPPADAPAPADLPDAPAQPAAQTEAAADAPVDLPATEVSPFWNVDYMDSSLSFVFEQGGDEVTGLFKSWEADIKFDPANLGDAKATVNVVLESIDIGEGSSDRNQAAIGSDWFDAGQFPMARFETTGFRQTGETGYEADANLTMKGETLPITLPFTLVIEDDTASMFGEVVLDRVRFGVGGTGEVSSEVRVIVDLTARRSR